MSALNFRGGDGGIPPPLALGVLLLPPLLRPKLSCGFVYLSFRRNIDLGFFAYFSFVISVLLA